MTHHPDAWTWHLYQELRNLHDAGAEIVPFNPDHTANDEWTEGPPLPDPPTHFFLHPDRADVFVASRPDIGYYLEAWWDESHPAGWRIHSKALQGNASLITVLAAFVDAPAMCRRITAHHFARIGAHPHLIRSLTYTAMIAALQAGNDPKAEALYHWLLDKDRAGKAFKTAELLDCVAYEALVLDEAHPLEEPTDRLHDTIRAAVDGGCSIEAVAEAANLDVERVKAILSCDR